MMDEWLTQVYGTNSGAGNDLEKTAQAMMLEKLADQEGIDLSGLNEEQLAALAQQVITENPQQSGEAAPVVAAAPPEQEEAQAKFAEADFLGRVMAHSYTQEITKIAQGDAPFPPKKEGGKCEKCGKENCSCPAAEKTAQGQLTQAITALGGTVVPPEEQQQAAAAAAAAAGNTATAATTPPVASGEVPQTTAQYVEKLAEARGQELAIGWLHENGYIK